MARESSKRLDDCKTAPGKPAIFADFFEPAGRDARDAAATRDPRTAAKPSKSAAFRAQAAAAPQPGRNRGNPAKSLP